jgi:hypothetical protein
LGRYPPRNNRHHSVLDSDVNSCCFICDPFSALFLQSCFPTVVFSTHTISVFLVLKGAAHLELKIRAHILTNVLAHVETIAQTLKFVLTQKLTFFSTSAGPERDLVCPSLLSAIMATCFHLPELLVS